MLLGSQFYGYGAPVVDAPYRTDFSIASVSDLRLRYLRVGVDAGSLCAVVGAAAAVGGLCGAKSRPFRVAVTCIAAALGAIVPNSVLPNHFEAGYSFHMAYLFCAPVLLLVAVPQAGLRSLTVGLTLAVAFLGPALDGERSRGQEWAIEQQRIQARMWRDIARDVSGWQVAPAEVLLTGIALPYSVAAHPGALRALPVPPETRISVVAYGSVPDRPLYRELGVRFVSPNSPLEENSQRRTWAFGADGRMMAVGPNGDEIAAMLGIASGEVIKYPALFEALRAEKGWNWQSYLNCGASLLSYGAIELAELCLRKSLAMESYNPYPYYYLGVVLSRSGRSVEARSAFHAAVERDDPKSPNPAFRAALLSGS